MKTKLPHSSSQKGFAISIDAFFALILLIALIGFVGTGALNVGEQVPATKVSTIGQNLEDALTSFENTGFLTGQLNPMIDQTNCQTKIKAIYDKIKTLLPPNTEANIKITRYTPKTDSAEMQICRTAWFNKEPATFDKCFNELTPDDICEPDNQPAIPASLDVLAGKKLIMQKQAGSRVGGQDKCTLSPAEGQLKEKKTKTGLESILKFDEEPVTITLNTLLKDQDGTAYSPSNPLNCYDPDSNATEQKKQIADVTISAVSGQRDPVSVMLLNDRSGSMAGFDMTVKTTSGTASGGTCLGGACGVVCTLSNKNTQYDNFTNKQDVETYNLTQARADSVGTGNKIFFTAVPNSYGGDCPVNSMVLWVQKPDLTVEKDSGSNLFEEVLSPTAGNYVVKLWDDSLTADNYSMYLTKELNNTVYNGTVPCSETLYDYGSTISITPNTVYKFSYTFTYSGNFSSNNNPEFRVLIGTTEVGSCEGGNGDDSGDCTVTLQNSSRSGPYETSGTYKIQVRVEDDRESRCTSPFNVTATYHLEGCFDDHPNCSPIVSGSINDGTCNSAVCATCPKGTDITGSSRALNVQTIDNYTVGADTVQDHERGIYADITNVQVDPTAVCKAGLGFTNPVQGDNNNFYFSFNPGSTNNWCNQLAYSDEQEYPTNSWCSNDLYNRPESAACTPGTPPNCTAPNPLPTGNYNILSWSDKSMSYTINWKAQRIDIAKKAGKIFLDKAHETGKPQDLFGLTSFSGDDSGGATLWQAMTNDVNAVKAALNKLRPYQGTPMAAGIYKARNNFGSSTNQKFVIMLTDGMANVRNNRTCSAPRFNCPTSNSTCCSVTDAIWEAIQARDTQNTTIFVVGISEQSIFTTEYVPGSSPNTLYYEALRDLAKDSTKYASECFDALGNLKPEMHCGKFYYATDEAALQEIYDLIMQEIGKRTETVNIQTNVPTGTEILCKSNCAGGLYCSYSTDSGGTITCSNQTPCTDPADCDGLDDNSWHETSKIIYSSQNISSPKWVQSFEARIPCDSNASACEDSSVTFPQASSFIQTPSEQIFWDQDLTNIPPKTVCEQEGSCNISVPFYYKNLKVVFTDGTIIQSKVSLTIKIGNKGYKAVTLTPEKPLRISFHAETAEGERLGVTAPFTGQTSGGFTASVELNPVTDVNDLILSGGTLNPKIDDVCTTLPCDVEIKGIEINSTGNIFAVINEDNKVKQCKKDDDDYISCSDPETYYYVIDYAAWSKT